MPGGGYIKGDAPADYALLTHPLYGVSFLWLFQVVVDEGLALVFAGEGVQE